MLCTARSRLRLGILDALSDMQPGNLKAVPGVLAQAEKQKPLLLSLAADEQRDKQVKIPPMTTQEN
jgi:hypothetical protein